MLGATTFETLDMDDETPAERNHDDLIILYGVPRRSIDDRSISIHACIIEEARFSAYCHVQSAVKRSRALLDCRG